MRRLEFAPNDLGCPLGLASPPAAGCGPHPRLGGSAGEGDLGVVGGHADVARPLVPRRDYAAGTQTVCRINASARPVAPPPAGTVHVWTVSLRCEPDDLSRLTGYLSADELAGARHFRFDHHRRRFIVRRAALRSILGEYLQTPSREVAYRAGPCGKLEFATGGRPPISFNSSHSEDWAAVAVASPGRLGVDIEMVRPAPEDAELAEGCLSAPERDALRSIPLGERPTSFFQLWARKEAFAKALGLGLCLPFDRFDVSVGPGPPSLLRFDDDDQPDRTWALAEPRAPRGFVAALALDDPIRALSYWSGSVATGIAPHDEAADVPAYR